MPDLLATYLDDHLMAATGGVRLAERSRDAHADIDPELHAFLAELTEEIREDRAAVRRMLTVAGGSPSPIKQVAAIAGELAGRLKSNGRLVRRSPLSSLIELEGLSVAVQGKRCGWLALRALADPRLATVDLDRLVERAEDQSERIEQRRLAVARDVLRQD